MSLVQAPDSDKSSSSATKLEFIAIEMDSLGGDDVKDVMVRSAEAKSISTSGRVTSLELGIVMTSYFLSYINTLI